MTDINIHNLRLFVVAMRQVVDTLPKAKVVNLKSVKPPACGTPGCHAGLAMLALDRLGVPDPSGGAKFYSFKEQARRLSVFLLPHLPQDDEGLTAIELWARKNPGTWGGHSGSGMFVSPLAFGQESYEFPSTVIVDWWEAVLARLEERS